MVFGDSKASNNMSNKINYSTLTQELIKGLRGKKSQNYYNKRLKQKTNQIHRWETGKSKITWVEFMRLLQLFKIDFRLLLNRFFRFQGDVESISLFLTHLFGNKKISELSKTVQLSEFKIRRILNGSSPAYLADILKIIDLLNRFRFLGFLNALIDLNKIGHGAMFKGTNGFLISDFDSHIILPYGKEADLTYYKPRPKEKLLPPVGVFQDEWINACKGDLKTSCDFDYAGKMLEMMNLGLVAYRVGKKLEYDGNTGRVTNCEEANALLSRKYRDGWTLNG